MLILSIALAAAAPSAAITTHSRARHPDRPSRTVRIARHGHKARRPITLSLRKFQLGECDLGSVCAVAATPSRYRLPLPETAGPDEKAMALAEDGSRCALIGQTICPHRTRKIIQIGEPAPGVPATALIR